MLHPAEVAEWVKTWSVHARGCVGLGACQENRDKRPEWTGKPAVRQESIGRFLPDGSLRTEAVGRLGQRS